MSKSFQALFCREHQCPPADFERQVFLRCVYRHARLIVPLVYRWNPAFFHEDFGFLRDLATTSSRGEVLCELNRFFGRNVRDRSWLRKCLLLRISGKRVLRLYRQLLRAERVESPVPHSAPPQTSGESKQRARGR